MEIQVVKEFSFDAAHYLPNHAGKCKQTHGHTYKLQVGVSGPIDADSGMVIDFGDLKKAVNNTVVDKLDHKYLNLIIDGESGGEAVPDFPRIPSAENMVIWIVKKLKEEICKQTEGMARLTFIRLYETPTSYAEWRSS